MRRGILNVKKYIYFRKFDKVLSGNIRIIFVSLEFKTSILFLKNLPN